jgi:chromosome segregation ATPase
MGMQELQNELSKSRNEKQKLEISFKGEMEGMNLKYIESQRQLSQISQNKQELENMMEKMKKGFEEDIRTKNEEIEFLRNNHQIKENQNLISEQKLAEIKGKVEIKLTKGKIENLEMELKMERDQVQELKEKLVTQSTQLQERTLLIENMQKENKNCSTNLESINNKIVKKLDVLEKQRESCPKHLTNLKEIQDSIKQMNSELSTLRNENQKLIEGRDTWFNEIKSELLKMKESQVISPQVSNVAPKPVVNIQKRVRGRESMGRITYEDRRTPTPPIVYRTERVVVNLNEIH